MTIEEMKENGAKHWKQQALLQVLRSEAEEGFKHIKYPIYDKELYKQAYFAAAEPREEKIAALEKENAELKEQIEKMKCCENCKNKGCDKADCYETCWYCKNKDKWSMRND